MSSTGLNFDDIFAQHKMVRKLIKKIKNKKELAKYQSCLPSLEDYIKGFKIVMQYDLKNFRDAMKSAKIPEPPKISQSILQKMSEEERKSTFWDAYPQIFTLKDRTFLLTTLNKSFDNWTTYFLRCALSISGLRDGKLSFQQNYQKVLDHLLHS